MAVTVSAWSDRWAASFAAVERDLRRALQDVPIRAIEHVGSTSVPGLAAKPILDVDVVVARAEVAAAIAALEAVGYRHLGALGVEDREAMLAPDADPERHVYVCVEGSIHLRNHLAVRDVLRRRPDLRDAYAAVKLALAADPRIDIDAYIASKSGVLQRVLEAAGMNESDRLAILRLNDPAS